MTIAIGNVNNIRMYTNEILMYLFSIKNQRAAPAYSQILHKKSLIIKIRKRPLTDL